MGSVKVDKAKPAKRTPQGGVDVRGARPPDRTRREGMATPQARMPVFLQRMPASAQRHIFLRQTWLFRERDAPVNPRRTEIDDRSQFTKDIKDRVLALGADDVGIAEYFPNLRFADTDPVSHTAIIVFAMNMSYDVMIDIGPNSQAEVHRVYYDLDALGVRIAREIGAHGYEARTHPNIGDFPLPALGYLAGLGELGKHGSLISPKLGSSFRLGAVSTDMPLVADGPQDYGIDEICANCQICARFCPGDAIKHEKKEVNGIERWYVDTPACEPYFFRLHGCKICLSVCPFNGRSVLKEQFKTMAKDIRDAGDADGMLRLIAERTGADYDFMKHGPSRDEAERAAAQAAAEGAGKPNPAAPENDPKTRSS